MIEKNNTNADKVVQLVSYVYFFRHKLFLNETDDVYKVINNYVINTTSCF